MYVKFYDNLIMKASQCGPQRSNVGDLDLFSATGCTIMHLLSTIPYVIFTGNINERYRIHRNMKLCQRFIELDMHGLKYKSVKF